MGAVDARVDHRDDDVRTAGGDRPRLLRVDVGVGHARRPVHGLAEVVEPPELVHGRVVRAPAVVIGVDEEVRLRVGRAWIPLERCDRLVGLPGGDRDERALDRRETS